MYFVHILGLFFVTKNMGGGIAVTREKKQLKIGLIVVEKLRSNLGHYCA